jgi:hypothetical protein
MKLHVLFVTAASVAVATSALAATNLNSSKSNVYKMISSVYTEAACLEAGGKIETKDGKKVCSLPPQAAQ